MPKTAKQQKLCSLSDIEEGESAAITAVIEGKTESLIAVRKGGEIYFYINRCPHLGTPLDFKPGRFLSHDKRYIQCSTHGAWFRIEDGYCVGGPCRTEYLKAVEILRNGEDFYLK